LLIYQFEWLSGCLKEVHINFMETNLYTLREVLLYIVRDAIEAGDVPRPAAVARVSPNRPVRAGELHSLAVSFGFANAQNPHSS
jgi:hypothetical protein